MNEVTNTTSTEGKTPATPSTSTVPGTAPSTPSMIAATSSPSMTAATTGTAPATLPADYLVGGYYQGEGKGRYVDPALVDQAAAIGTSLAKAGVSPSAVNKMVRTLKAAAKLPYAAQQGALKKLMPQILDMENKKKCPPMLREMVERNQAAVKSETDYAACLDHLRDVGIYLTAAQS